MLSDKKALKIEGLTVKYADGTVTVIEDLDFKAESGQFILVTGPSGGGKSSFLYTVNGIVPFLVDAEMVGKVELGGSSVLSMQPSERARVLGSVLQNPDDQIIFDRVDDEIAFPLENLEVSASDMQDRIDDAVQRMQLDTDKDPSVLSGGEKQKLITATTLSMGQKVLLFDEPLANLDYTGAMRLLDTLRKLCKEEGYIVLFVEHRLDWVLEYADAVLWIDMGQQQHFTDKEEFLTFWNKRLDKDLEFSWNHMPKTGDGEVIIKAEGISYKVRDKLIIDKVDFTIRRGERWVIIGDNGSGKTSLLNLLSGLQKPSAGTIYCKYDKKEMYKKIGVIMQNPNYQLFMPTVRQEIEYQAVSSKRVDDLIDAFELRGFEDRHPHSLSEGQKRKLGVAAILAMDPEVLLFDEPTVGQDYRSLALIIKELDRMNTQRPLTMITITHDSRCAHYLGDYVLRMEKGRVAGTGGLELLESI